MIPAEQGWVVLGADHWGSTQPCLHRAWEGQGSDPAVAHRSVRSPAAPGADVGGKKAPSRGTDGATESQPGSYLLPAPR